MDQTLHLLLPKPSFPLLPIPSPAAKLSPSPGRRRRPSLYLLRGHHHRSLPSPHFEVRAMAGGGSELAVEGAFCGNGAGSELPVELCLTRVLPPALTLEEGGRRIKEAVAEIRSCPPGLSSGIIRFQVGVPPSVKPLTWLLCQPHSSVGYPQFYLSGKAIEELSSDSVSHDEVYGVSGIGSAVYFTGSACAGSDISSSIKRYLSVDSPLIRAYGFEGTYYDVKSSTMKHGANSCFFFIPQIELDEFEGISILAATMAWDECSFCTFEKAFLDFESSLYKAMFNVWPIGQVFYNKWIIDVCEKSALINVKSAYLVLLTANSLVQRYMLLNLRHLGDGSKFQYYIMFSRNVAFTSKMGCMKELNPSLEDCENVNILWASLIVEECIRLGLTYFCIAPGSRSSPLAIAASAHSLATCVSCYDERSLAFHAIGHVKGSGMAAIIITSSGTAASNLYPAVVEASQDFLPLILLTADRPPELQDAGANQSINQVNHFGSFVKFFFNIPPPTDEIPARMVLTTVDSAVHIAMQVPEGPVHVNCAFREPLANIPKDWSLQALHGLRVWALNLEPFTKYMRPHYSASSQVVPSQISHILDMIQGAKQGLLFVGAIHDEDEMWAALLLVRHLSWPVVTDILSGLRLRRALTSIQGMEENLVFIDHLDHILLSERFSSWFRPDVILHVC